MAKTIRILQIMGKVGSGGVESVIMNYYRHINKEKVQFDFVVHKDAEKAYVNEIHSLGGVVYEVTPYSENIIKFTYEIYKIVKVGNYNIVHSNLNSLSFFPLIAAYFAGAKVRILHNHTMANKSEGIRSWIKCTLRPFAKIFANQYWACGKDAAEWIYGKKSISRNEVTIVNNAIDLNKFAFNMNLRNKLRSELKVEDCLVIGHVGRFVATKNHSLLIEIFNKLVNIKDDSRLLLIGDGPLVKPIMNKVNALGLMDKILFLGERRDVADLYNAMDIFVLPSLYEGLPVVGVEVQANSLPSLMSNSITKEIKYSNIVFFVDIASEIENWVEKIIDISRKKVRKCNYESNISKFDINKQCEKLEQVYITLKNRDGGSYF